MNAMRDRSLKIAGTYYKAEKILVIYTIGYGVANNGLEVVYLLVLSATHLFSNQMDPECQARAAALSPGVLDHTSSSLAPF